MMWLLFAFLSALFAGLTAILAKCGIENMDSNVATAIRTIVVLIFSWVLVFVMGVQNGIFHLSGKTITFLVLSGVVTGASWLCYFHALQIGDVNRVTPIDKSSTILTMILAFLFFGETVGAVQICAMVLMGAGTYLMIQKKEAETGKKTKKTWLLYALLSAVFASLTSILAKVGKSSRACEEGWHAGCRFKFGNGYPHRCCSCNGVGCCICNRKTENNSWNWQKKWGISCVIRRSNRSVVALLFPCAANRTGKCRCAD